MPRSVLEAMAFELPVLGTDVYGLPELIRDGVTGYLCQPNDRLSLIAALSRGLDDPPQRRRTIAAAARELVCQRHSVSGFVNAYATLLNSLIPHRAEEHGPGHSADGGARTADPGHASVVRQSSSGARTRA
jgi:glycosyltransferase involved in cell wall biosynthesis